MNPSAGKWLKLILNSILIVIGVATHRIGWESHLGRCHRRRSDRPSIADCVASDCYQQAASKCRSPSSATLAAIDSPLIFPKCRRFSHSSTFRRCFFSFAMNCHSRWRESDGEETENMKMSSVNRFRNDSLSLDSRNGWWTCTWSAKLFRLVFKIALECMAMVAWVSWGIY